MGSLFMMVAVMDGRYSWNAWNILHVVPSAPQLEYGLVRLAGSWMADGVRGRWMPLMAKFMACLMVSIPSAQSRHLIRRE